MPILVTLDDVLHQRRMTLSELAERIDITLANLSILKTGKARAIRFSTLEAICEALSCQPGDILHFEPEQAEREQPAEARERIQKLLVTGDNRLKQGVSVEKVRETYEEALAVARDAGLEDAIRPLVEVRLADLERLARESPPPVPPAA